MTDDLDGILREGVSIRLDGGRKLIVRRIHGSHDLAIQLFSKGWPTLSFNLPPGASQALVAAIQKLNRPA